MKSCDFSRYFFIPHNKCSHVPLFSLMRRFSHSFTFSSCLCVGDKTRSLTCDRPFVLSVLSCSTPHPIHHWSSQPAPDSLLLPFFIHRSTSTTLAISHHFNFRQLPPRRNKQPSTSHRQHEIQVQGRAPVSRCLSPRRSRDVTTNTPSQLREAQGALFRHHHDPKFHRNTNHLQAEAERIRQKYTDRIPVSLCPASVATLE